MPEQTPDFPQLLPPLGDELLADDALAAVAAQIPEVPDLTETYEPPEPLAYGMTWVFDFEAGRFVTAGNSVTRCWDYDTLRMWATAVQNIDRGAHPIFAEDTGMDDSHAMIGSVKNDPSAQQQYMQDLARALLAHDRITRVTNFDFTDVPPGQDESHYRADPTTDYTFVSYEVTTDDQQILTINAAVEN